MTIEKNTFVENEFIKEVNRIAEKAYALKENNDRSYRTEQNKLAALVLDVIRKCRPGNIDDSDYEGLVSVVLVSAMKSWKPGNAGFWAVFKFTLDKQLPNIYYQNLDTYQRGAYRKMKKASRELSEEKRSELRPEVQREAFYANPNEDDPVKEVAGNENTENEALQSDIMKKHFDVLNNAVIAQKKKYQNSPKPCYPAYFYTEFVTHSIEKEKDRSVFDKAEKGLMKVIEHDFVSYYMDGDNNSIAGIAQGSLKKASVFTGDPSDDRPCGYDLENIVYAKYFSALKKRDKIQSDSSISQLRVKFMQLIQLEMKNSLNAE